ncbi:hypothetical protein [Mycobacteroides abscessus]|uniref:hypothetical protein n=1 Tax=Mycobacteroides abscessus TaxID=36809 RepID=UPI00092C0DF4|nr:hypothetical protein [Mycobacteroides abscessus]SIE21747.1 Uncharacterised protein [Mycobacteroides abscessus subsp. abscessus]SIG92299.1 Uncharacterised protein [Mycobacteroides abscessus subsp. abscessus]SIH23223.1 Uncharacterised protein [Mycobacteroides abscessus subsp. abscessus]SIM25782.1 Uncharacterised protein [Mycobacteroides abscessus subsp. abscessus]SKV88035.1 Uncharacterised protein [Mycobacteroides abscessus subsp. abscessus]
MSLNSGYVERQALCCVCGNLRTCRRPKKYREENFWLTRTVDRSWHRETGDLKCTACGKNTTHALIYPEGDQLRNHAERLERIALGVGDPLEQESPGVAEQVKRNYRVGRQTNPHLRHSWWSIDAEQARAAGKSTVSTLCGNEHEIQGTCDEDDDDDDPDTAVAQTRPARYYWQVFSDDAPPEGWDCQDCPDCTRVVNRWIVDRNRKDLLAKLAELMRTAIDLSAPELERVLSTVQAVLSAVQAVSR